MLSTSGTYLSQSMQIEVIIREAYERIGILEENIGPQKLTSAKNSLNFILLDWMNKGVNLWTLDTAFLPLIPGKSKYELPTTVSDIIQANIRTSTRQLNGTAAATTGTADQAFDSDNLTACTQTTANGNISYDYGVGNVFAITFLGIQSNTTQTYSLDFQVSQDNINWSTLFTIPSQEYEAGVNTWFDVPIEQNSRAYRVVETGEGTLDIQELYFNNTINDQTISNVSRNTYISYPQKSQQGRPTTFYFNRQITTNISLWPVPNPTYNCFFYSYKKVTQDIGNLYTNTIDIPAHFYPALVWGLSFHLAIKFKPELMETFSSDYERAFERASVEDTEDVDLTINVDPNKSGYY